MQPTKKIPLFIITGASCAGKSTLCEELFKKETNYIVMESDLLWHTVYDTPENHYHAYRKLWLKVCASISQIGKPVILCGCNTPDQLENLPERALFAAIHYLAVVCDDPVLIERTTKGRHISDKSRITASLDFNRWLKKNASTTSPQITLLDTTDLTPKQAASVVDAWILEKLDTTADETHALRNNSMDEIFKL